MKNLFRKTTALFMTLCLIVGMTGLPMAAYAEGLDDAAIVAADKDALVIGFGSGDSAEGATGNLILVTTGASGSGIAWLSDTPEIIANDGAVTRPAADAEDAEVTLTATITYGEAEDTKAFTVTVPKESEPQMLFGMMSVTWVGDGTEGNPYQVSSADHLAWITANSRTAHYIQTANIDLAAAGFTNWTPIGGFNQFTGTYNGNGYSISNLFINSTRDQVGLFGYIGSGGMLENIKLENVTVFSSTSGAYVGALVGTNMGSVYNCSVSGSVSGGNSTYVGGLIGNHSGAVSNCSSAGNINGGNSASIGGLIGNGGGAVTYNYSTAFVTGGDNANVGGLLGRTYVTSISDNYSTGTVTGGGNANVGGLVGEIDDGDVSSSYSTGSVNGGTDAKLGGLVGYGNGVANGCYYLNTAAATSAGGAPLTDAQMKKQASFANWDFGGAWFVAEAQSYPVLAWQVSFAGGDGSEGAPYQVETALQLNKVRGYLNNTAIHFEQVSDITLPAVAAGESNWTPIWKDWSTLFTGSYDGGGYTIEGLTITNSPLDLVGLFGHVGNGGTLENINLENVNVSSSTFGAQVGALVSRNEGGVSNCSVSGTVSDNGSGANVGGLAGSNYGSITDSSSGAAVTGRVAGGLAGVNGGAITGSGSSGAVAGYVAGGLVGENGMGPGKSFSDNHSTGDVTGSGDYTQAGGLIGLMSGSSYGITNCYSTGDVAGSGNNSRTGGLIGYMDGDALAITSCYSTGDVTGSGSGSRIGGLIGNMFTHFSSMTNCYSTSAAAGSGSGSRIGGLVGCIETPNTSVTYCYSTGSVSATDGATAGGLIAFNNSLAVTTNSYYLDTAAASSADGTALTDTQMKKQASFTGWDFDTVWQMREDHTYPIFLWQTLPPPPPPPSGGGGTGGRTPSYNAIISGGGSVPVTVNASTGSASLNLAALAGNLSGGGSITVTVPSIPGVSSFTANLPAASLSGTGAGSLTLDTPVGSITIPGNMLAGTGLTGSAGVTIGEGSKDGLPDNVKNALGDRPAIQLTLTIGGVQTEWNNPDAPVTVSIPYTPTAAELANPESIVVWYIDGSGNVVSVPNGRYDPATKTVTFFATHFSDYAVAYVHKTFNDVAAGAWYNKAVSFIAAREITSGTGNGNYSPDAKLTRGEFIVLMMRSYGIAPDKNATDNFVDAGNTYYSGYLAAAKRLGITAGVGNHMYAPGKEITRQEMFTLLYNALKSIEQLPGGDSGKTVLDFSDATQISSWAQEAMAAFVVTGTVGGSNGKLNPTGTTTRAEMAQVLYNLLGK